MNIYNVKKIPLIFPIPFFFIFFIFFIFFVFFRFSAAGTTGNASSKGQKYSSSLNGTASLANHLNGKRHGSMAMDQVTPYIVEAIKGRSVGYTYVCVCVCVCVCCCELVCVFVVVNLCA